jgi:ribosomal protein S1
MDWKENKVSISLKDSSNDPWSTNVPFKEGDIVKATVESIKQFGVFVRLNDHFHALLPNKETGYPARTALTNHFKPGDEIDVFVTEVNPAKKQIAVSLAKAKDAKTEWTSRATFQNTRHPVNRASDFFKEVLEEVIFLPPMNTDKRTIKNIEPNQNTNYGYLSNLLSVYIGVYRW